MDCDHADGTPTASFVAWRGAPGRSTAGVARSAVVRGAPRYRWVVPAQLRTRHAPVIGVSRVSWRGHGYGYGRGREKSGPREGPDGRRGV